ncbi:hypothetical protein SETIT_6G135100v2 [Setaria italica]|uniref:Uncharacterized protein n=1 Tax=Setaria italica TaxID=4555 RepID=A0A368RL41_SETIT|nr:hypothetical protein SETIT_6G135100v2 [Setaria italica]
MSVINFCLVCSMDKIIRFAFVMNIRVTRFVLSMYVSLFLAYPRQDMQVSMTCLSLAILSGNAHVFSEENRSLETCMQIGTGYSSAYMLSLLPRWCGPCIRISSWRFHGNLG